MATPSPPTIYEQVPQDAVPVPTAQPLVFPVLPPQPDLHPQPELQPQPPYPPQQIMPPQPPVTQPVVVSNASNPASSATSVDTGYESREWEFVKNREHFSLNTATLGQMQGIDWVFMIRPVNAYCNICRSINATYTERCVGPLAYPFSHTLRSLTQGSQ